MKRKKFCPACQELECTVATECSYRQLVAEKAGQPYECRCQPLQCDHEQEESPNDH